MKPLADDRVKTPQGNGVVIYVRFSAPDYREPTSYSVRLDEKSQFQNYKGTIFPADQVTKIENQWRDDE